jgi:hypothetical protein
MTLFDYTSQPSLCDAVGRLGNDYGFWGLKNIYGTVNKCSHFAPKEGTQFLWKFKSIMFS